MSSARPTPLPSRPAARGAVQDRAKVLADMLSRTMDRIPGAREAMPRLAELEATLLQKGLAALNDAPLPTLEELRGRLAELMPHEDPTQREFRARLLASVDRRRRARTRNLRTYVADEQVYAGEATMSDFMDVLQTHAPR